MGRVERILRDVGEAYIVACFHVEHVEHHTAAEAQSSIEALEVIVGERVLGRAQVLIFDLSADATGQITAKERRHGDVVVELQLVFQQERYLEVVQTVGEFLIAR